MDIRMIATDLDGTLLNPQGEISQYNLEAIQACEKQGIRVVMSSGRNFAGVRLLARKAGLNSPIISCNGGRVDASPFGPAIMEDVLPADTARIVFDVIKRSGLYIECYTDNTIYRANPRLSPFLSSPDDYHALGSIPDGEGFAQSFVDDIDRMEAEGMFRSYKFAAFSKDPIRLDAIRHELNGLPVTISSSFPFNMEIMEKGKGKGRAIRFLADWLNIPISQVMAFGDNTNDMEMLQASGVPVAMGNAVPELKQIAKIIAPPNYEDGEGRVIREYILKENV